MEAPAVIIYLLLKESPVLKITIAINVKDHVIEMAFKIVHLKF